MKLYDSRLSPYASRVRLQLYLKNIAAEIVEVPEGGSHTPDYARMNPLEKIPTLDDGGYFLPESSAIGEYIEDTRPTPALRPSDAKERARMRVIYNIADQYLLTPLFVLFDQFDPKSRNAAVVDEQLTELNKALAGLEHYLAGGKYALGEAPSLADCALVPSLFFAQAVGPGFGLPDVFARVPKVKAYYASVQTDPAVQKLVQELSAALVAYLQKAAQGA